MDLFLDSPGGGGGPAGSSAANVACRRARKPGEKVFAAQQQPSVCPRRVSGASPASVVVAGKALPHRGQGVVRELHEVEGVHADRRGRQVRADGFRERRGRVGGHHLDPVPRGRGAGRKPGPDPGVTAAIEHAEDAAGVQVADRGNPRFVPAPPTGGQPEVTDSAEAVLSILILRTTTVSTTKISAAAAVRTAPAPRSPRSPNKGSPSIIAT